MNTVFIQQNPDNGTFDIRAASHSDVRVVLLEESISDAVDFNLDGTDMVAHSTMAGADVESAKHIADAMSLELSESTIQSPEGMATVFIQQNPDNGNFDIKASSDGDVRVVLLEESLQETCDFELDGNEMLAFEAIAYEDKELSTKIMVAMGDS